MLDACVNLFLLGITGKVSLLDRNVPKTESVIIISILNLTDDSVSFTKRLVLPLSFHLDLIAQFLPVRFL